MAAIQAAGSGMPVPATASSRLMKLMPVPTPVVPGWNARVARWVAA